MAGLTLFIPIIVVILGIIEVIAFSSISPFNWVFAAIIFIIAALMFKRMLSFQQSEEMPVQQAQEEEFAKFKTPKFESIEKEILSGTAEEEKKRKALEQMKKALK